MTHRDNNPGCWAWCSSRTAGTVLTVDGIPYCSEFAGRKPWSLGGNSDPRSGPIDLHFTWASLEKDPACQTGAPEDDESCPVVLHVMLGASGYYELVLFDPETGMLPIKETESSARIRIFGSPLKLSQGGETCFWKPDPENGIPSIDVLVEWADEYRSTVRVCILSLHRDQADEDQMDEDQMAMMEQDECADIQNERSYADNFL
jgi:hypothetical protein